MTTRIAVIADRPGELGADHALRSPLWVWVREQVKAELNRNEVDQVDVMLAPGAPELVARVAVDTGRDLHVWVPCAGFGDTWPAHTRTRLRHVASLADATTHVSDQTFSVARLQACRRQMCADADMVLMVAARRPTGALADVADHCGQAGTSVRHVDVTSQRVRHVRAALGRGG